MLTGWARVLIVVGVGLLMGVGACQVLTRRYAQDNPPAPVAAVVESITGEVLHVHMEGSVAVGTDQPAREGMAIREDDQFKVPHEARIRIRTKVGSLIELAGVNFDRTFARIHRLVPGGDYLGVTLFEGRVALAAVPDQSWEINGGGSAARGKGGLVMGQSTTSADSFRLIVKDGTGSVQESKRTTEWRTVTAGQRFSSTGINGQLGTIEPAPLDPLGDLNLLRQAQEKAKR